jgi:hypothetical protein
MSVLVVLCWSQLELAVVQSCSCKHGLQHSVTGMKSVHARTLQVVCAGKQVLLLLSGSALAKRLGSVRTHASCLRSRYSVVTSHAMLA